jgi:tRNA G10  N-methylase Trm11
MPSPRTFSIPPIEDFLDRWLPRGGVVVDPFCGTKPHRFAAIANDLAISRVDAEDFCRGLSIRADAVLFDPPYSPRQISECYKSVGFSVGVAETQNASLYKRVRDALDSLLIPGGIALSFGWNSSGFGKSRGYEQVEILLVAHGGAHNDTICVAERKR